MIEPSPENLTFTPSDSRSRGLRWLLVAIVPLAVIYLSMLNAYWVPSGDGEVYTCIARSLARGEGLIFNGSRAAIAPPGWPLVLSLAMRISAEFWFLKLVTTFSMLASLATAFFILRRFVTNRASSGIILLTGILSSVYPLTYWMHTEAFFCLLGFGAILIAFRIAERRARLEWEAPLLLFLLGFCAFTRWPGVLHLVLVIPILLSGPNRPWRRLSTWVIVALCVVVAIGTFRATYSYLSLTQEEKELAIRSGGTADGETDVDVGGEFPLDETGTTLPSTLPTTGSVTPIGDDAETPGADDLRGHGKRSLVGEIAYRVGTSGKWFSWLLWQPTRFGQSVWFINLSALIAGWLAIAMLLLALARGIARHQFFWIGLAAYTGGLCVLWPNPNARYFVPVAPFIILGVLLGIQVVSDFGRRRANPLTPSPGQPPEDPDASPTYQISSIHVRALSLPAKLLMVAFVVATLVSNLPLLGIDILVFRSDDFYGRYEAGANKDLMRAAQYINAHPIPPTRRVAVCEWYDNMGRERYSKFGQRALHLLTDRQVITPPRKKEYNNRPTQRAVRVWAKKVGNDADFYVYQTTWNPWRVWHFRLDLDLQEKLTGKKPVATESGGWELFVRVGSNYPRARLDRDLQNLPTRVPGL